MGNRISKCFYFDVARENETMPFRTNESYFGADLSLQRTKRGKNIMYINFLDIPLP